MKELAIGFVLGFLVAYAMRKETVSSSVSFNQTPQYSWFELFPL